MSEIQENELLNQPFMYRAVIHPIRPL